MNSMGKLEAGRSFDKIKTQVGKLLQKIQDFLFGIEFDGNGIEADNQGDFYPTMKPERKTDKTVFRNDFLLASLALFIIDIISFKMLPTSL